MSKLGDAEPEPSPPAETSEPACWYWAAATYKAVHVGVRRRRHLWERTVFLVRASSEPAALEAACQLALKEDVEYLTPNGTTVRWIFQQIERI